MRKIAATTCGCDGCVHCNRKPTSFVEIYTSGLTQKNKVSGSKKSSGKSLQNNVFL
jgi:hypothetical protein